jgi:YHS domain-containing protein
VVVEYVPGAARAAYADERVFPSASVYKSALAYEVLHQVDEGRLSLDEPLTIDPADAVGRVEHQGQTYYFCAQECKQKFDANPQQYAKAGKAGEQRR